MWDCAIIGGGPAGLTAATYLGRFKRDVVLIDSGESRVKRIPLARNVPGFASGVSGLDLYARLLDQAARYGALFRGGRAHDLQRTENGFRVMFGADEIEARTVLLATGAALIEPELANLDAALAAGQLRYCPICDGFEASGKRIAVLGGRSGALAEAHFLQTFSDDVTYFWQGAGRPSKHEHERAAANGIKIAATPITRLTITDTVEIASGDRAGAFDVLYPSLGCVPQSDLARVLGAHVSASGGIRVDAHQGAGVEGLYAAGDVLQGLDQIASACGQGAIAAVAIHNRLLAL